MNEEILEQAPSSPSGHLPQNGGGKDPHFCQACEPGAPLGGELAFAKQMKHAAALPVLTKPAHARKLEPFARDFFALESRCTDLYDLCFEHTPVPGREYTTDVVRMGGAGDE